MTRKKDTKPIYANISNHLHERLLKVIESINNIGGYKVSMASFVAKVIKDAVEKEE
jgi:hypothetical protein